MRTFLDGLPLAALGVVLAAACVSDWRCRRVPNALTLPALTLGLALAIWRHGAPGLWQSLAGVGVASLALAAYAGRMLGAGDVKLLWAAGALTGPQFMLAMLLNTALAGGFLALVWAVRLGARRLPREDTAQAGRLPYAPAIALGALVTAGIRHWGLSP